tara:strand:- start:872 stop:2146 length:1275 start_codon:yes stop_codon:yes gene_type:complete
MTDTNLNITANPRFNSVILGGDSNILTNNKGACLVGCSNDAFVKITQDCKNICASLDSQYIVGHIPKIENLYGGSNDYDILTDFAGYHFDNIRFVRSLADITFKKCGNGDLKIRMGLSRNIMRDNKGTWKGGWYINDCRCYLGEGFINNLKPFPFDFTSGKGIQVRYDTKKLSCYADIQNNYLDAYRVTSGVKATQGFLSPDTPALCNIGVSYKTSIPCNACCNLHCQRWTNGNTNVDPPNRQLACAYTKNADSAIQQSGAMNSFTLLGATELKDVELNGNITCLNSNIENADKQGRIMQWSIGCVSKCKGIKCLRKILPPPVAYGIVLSTPFYLNTSAGSIKNDTTPLVCEAYCLLQYCGFNIPIFVDLMDDKENKFNGKDGKSFIIGTRPNTIYQFNCNSEGNVDCGIRNIVECKTEGGIDE